MWIFAHDTFCQTLITFFENLHGQTHYNTHQSKNKLAKRFLFSFSKASMFLYLEHSRLTCKREVGCEALSSPRFH